MYNDFMIICLPADPSGITTAKDTRTSQRVALAGAPFASRVVASGTQMKERGL